MNRSSAVLKLLYLTVVSYESHSEMHLYVLNICYSTSRSRLIFSISYPMRFPVIEAVKTCLFGHRGFCRVIMFETHPKDEVRVKDGKYSCGIASESQMEQ